MKKLAFLILVFSTTAIAAPSNPPIFILGQTVAKLPSAAAGKNQFWTVTDGATASDCSTGMGTYGVMCWSNGTTWTAVGGGGSGSGTVSAGTAGQCGIYAASGTTISGANCGAAPPYFTDGTHFFDHDGYTVTKPSASPVWINSVNPTSLTAGANGNVVVVGNAGNHIFQTQTCTTSVEAVMRGATFESMSNNYGGSLGVWVYDSTNSKIYKLQIGLTPTSATASYIAAAIDTFTYSGLGNPSFSSQTFYAFGSYGYSDYVHLRILKSGSNINYQVTLDGGATYFTIATQAVGTLSQCGYSIYETPSLW